MDGFVESRGRSTFRITTDQLEFCPGICWCSSFGSPVPGLGFLVCWIFLFFFFFFTLIARGDLIRPDPSQNKAGNKGDDDHPGKCSSHSLFTA